MKLMNSAMMPQAGHYNAKQITFDEFKETILRNKDNIESYIGYPQNAMLIEKWTGIHINTNRMVTHLNSKDTMLIMKLKYRMTKPENKGKQINDNDFEFMLIEYSRKNPQKSTLIRRGKNIF